jgi:hypothetical protein
MCSQLGVNDSNVIVNGGLAGNTRFLGSNTAETISIANGTSGGWNNDRAQSVTSSAPWAGLGGQSGSSVDAGVFVTFGPNAGGVAEIIGHRTILSGY